MAIEQLELETRLNKVDFAIKLLQDNEPLALDIHPDGYAVYISGGKDSDVTNKIVKISGVKHTLHYCVSPIDPPQIYEYIRNNYPEAIWEYHAKHFWEMVERKRLPMRDSRWCCEIIKEAGGWGRLVVTGMRASESRTRKTYSYLKSYIKSKKETKLMLSPILNFTDYDVWQFIRMHKLSYCNLYDEGADRKSYGEGIFKRLGCVLCPFSRNIKNEIDYFPKVTRLWKRACNNIVKADIERGYLGKRGKPLKHKFKTGEEMFQWWIRRG